ncbi:peptidyl-tRNA hydrolase [Candidatus Woesearchaeota archaeon]|nr:peptidyl-tRNA hydrolase [Candidatus Woesearchaeota archaeon]
MYKQVILARQDLKMKAGKLAAQVAHASLEAALNSDRKTLGEWLDEGGKKVVLKAADEKELLKHKQLADREKLKNALIRDAGRTALKPGTITCLGIGPDKEEKIDRVTGKLRML